LHLYKDPMAQRHWSNQYGVLSRAVLDTQKVSWCAIRGSKSFEQLSRVFQWLWYISATKCNGIEYVSLSAYSLPVKKQPYQSSSTEWSALANHCHDIKPTNLSWKSIVHGEAWIKETRNDCRKHLHQKFQQYHWSGQHDAEMVEWCSPKEVNLWVWATNWKTPGQNSVILDVTDFEGIGRQMPEGTEMTGCREYW